MKLKINRNTIVVATFGIIIGAGSFGLAHRHDAGTNTAQGMSAAQAASVRAAAARNPRLARIVAEAAADSAAQRAHNLMSEAGRKPPKMKLANTVANAR